MHDPRFNSALGRQEVLLDEFVERLSHRIPEGLVLQGLLDAKNSPPFGETDELVVVAVAKKKSVHALGVGGDSGQDRDLKD